MNGDRDFVGRGWAFPLGVGPRGGIAMVTGTDEIDAALKLILSTAPGERVMRPEFGCRIWDLLFAPVEPNALGLMVQAVREAVGRWEPRVDVQEVQAVPDAADASRVLIRLAYTIRPTNTRRNLVYPFYVIPKEG
jgi:phage baseplate assembly protein W